MSESAQVSFLWDKWLDILGKGENRFLVVKRLSSMYIRKHSFVHLFAFLIISKGFKPAYEITSY